MQPQNQGQPPAQQQDMYQQQPPIGQQQPPMSQQQGMYQQQPPIGQQQGMYQQQPPMGQQQGMYQQQPPMGQQQGMYQQQPPMGQQQGMYQQKPPMGQQQGMYQQQPPMGQQQGIYQQQPPIGQQQGVYQQQPPMGQQQGMYQQQPPMGQQQGKYQQQPPMGQQQGMYQQQPPMGQQQGMHQEQPQMGQEQSTHQQQPPMGQEQSNNEQAPMNPGPEPNCACGKKVSHGAKTAARLNILFFTLFAVTPLIEYGIFHVWMASNPGWIKPGESNPILDCTFPVMGIFLVLIIPNCFILCVKQAWAAYLWIGTNAAAYLLLLIWIIVAVAADKPPNTMVGKFAFTSIATFVLLGGLDGWFTLVMLQYAKFLLGQDQPQDGMAFEPPPGETPSGQVEPVPSHYSQAQPPPYMAAKA